MPVKTKDKGAKALLERAKIKATVKVGVIGAGAAAPKEDKDEAGNIFTPEAGDTVADVATANEFGLGVPERPFVRGYVDENEAQIKEWERKVGVMLLDGRRRRGPKPTMELFGLQVASGMQERIDQGIPPANSPATIERKGSSKPLVNTGQLKSSITYEVKLNGD